MNHMEALNKQKKVTVNKKGFIRTLAPCLKGYGGTSLLSVICVIGESVLEMFIPFIMTGLIDEGIPAAQNGDLSIVFSKGGIMIALALLSLVLGAACARFASVSSTGLAKGVRFAVFNKIQRFSYANMDKFTTASLVTRLTNDVTNIQHSYQMIIRMCVRAPVLLVVATTLAIKLNADLAIIFAFALPILAISFALLASNTYPRFKKMLTTYDGMNSGVQENLIAMRIVKAFVRDKHENTNFDKRSDGVKNATIAAERILVLNNPISQLVLYACMIAVCFFGGKMMIAETMTKGTFTSFLSYISQILMAVTMISMVFLQLVLTRASVSRITEVLDEVPDISDDSANPDLKVSDGSIEFSHVNFRYNREKGEYVLSDIDLSIKPGEIIGVIGGTGSAKTTLVQLIPRLYDVSVGSIKVGGHDVREYKLKNLRDAVSMVLQNNVLFSGTIADNLRWGDKNATQEQIETAAKHACAHEFVMSFPNGYQTDLGQGGVNVSGGQKQRLCIARALLKKPKVIILDDSTSAVDTTTDANIRHALKHNLDNITTIIIAQRINSVMDADRIIVLDEGRITDFGTHEELLGRCEIYQEVYNSQIRKEDN